MRIRQATTTDHTFLLELTDRLAEFPLPAWRTGAQIAAADQPILEAALAHPVPETLLQIAETEDGQPLGYIFATTQVDYFTGERHGHIEILSVARSAEGQGVGRALLDAADNWAATQQYGHITLNVFTTNERARGLYHHLGFEPELVKYRKSIRPIDGPTTGPTR